MRNDFRATHGSYGCGKKSALDKIPSVHIFTFYLAKLSGLPDNPFRISTSLASKGMEVSP